MVANLISFKEPLDSISPVFVESCPMSGPSFGGLGGEPGLPQLEGGSEQVPVVRGVHDGPLRLVEVPLPS